MCKLCINLKNIYFSFIIEYKINFNLKNENVVCLIREENIKDFLLWISQERSLDPMYLSMQWRIQSYIFLFKNIVLVDFKENIFVVMSFDK